MENGLYEMHKFSVGFNPSCTYGITFLLQGRIVANDFNRCFYSILQTLLNIVFHFFVHFETNLLVFIYWASISQSVIVAFS